MKERTVASAQMKCGDFLDVVLDELNSGKTLLDENTLIDMVAGRTHVCWHCIDTNDTHFRHQVPHRQPKCSGCTYGQCVFLLINFCGKLISSRHFEKNSLSFYFYSIKKIYHQSSRPHISTSIGNKLGAVAHALILLVFIISRNRHLSLQQN